MGNLLIYSAAEIFCISQQALPRCRRLAFRVGAGPVLGNDAGGVQLGGSGDTADD